MRLSVITPTFHRPQKLRRCLSSLATQTEPDFEVIVVNDGADGDAHDVVSQFVEKLDLKYLSTPSRLGPGGARNAALRVVDAPWVMFVDDDDWLDRDYIAAAVTAAANSPSYNLYYPCRMMIHRGTGVDLWEFPSAANKWEIVADEHRRRCARVPFTGGLVSTGLLRRGGDFEGLAPCGDWRWKVENWSSIWPLRFEPDGLYHVDLTGERISSQDRAEEKASICRYIEENYPFALR